MALPIRTTVEDIEAVCGYLLTKPTGATTVEARAIIDPKRLDGRKLAALKYWGLIEDNSGKLKLTESGRTLAKDKCARRAEVLRRVVRSCQPYVAAVERAVHRDEWTVSATELAANWHDNFRGEASEADKILNDQAVCFFQLAQGADLGKIIIGRKGQPTRFEFAREAAEEMVADGGNTEPEENAEEVTPSDETPPSSPLGEAPLTAAQRRIRRVFITHGKNKQILNQIKQLVEFGKFEAVVAEEHETTAKPVPDKVLDDMRSCQAAVIHVGTDGTRFDTDGRERAHINENVLIEIGAAMALYGRNFILLVEDGVALPSNLQGLYECRYHGGELSMDATMKILKAFSEFR